MFFPFRKNKLRVSVCREHLIHLKRSPLPSRGKQDWGLLRLRLVIKNPNKIKKTGKIFLKSAKNFFNRHTFVIFYMLYLVKNTNKCSDFNKKCGSDPLQKLGAVG